MTGMASRLQLETTGAWDDVRMTDAKPLVQSSSGMIHVEGCPYIAHYVDGHREKTVYEYGLGHDIQRVDEQTELVLTIPMQSVERRWVDVRIDPSGIARIGAYSRCSHCAPDVPEYTSPTRYVSKEAGTLMHKDVGRESVAGRISAVVHNENGVEVVFGDGTSRKFAPDARLEFPVVRRPT